MCLVNSLITSSNDSKLRFYCYSFEKNQVYYLLKYQNTIIYKFTISTILCLLYGINLGCLKFKGQMFFILLKFCPNLTLKQLKIYFFFFFVVLWTKTVFFLEKLDHVMGQVEDF